MHTFKPRVYVASATRLSILTILASHPQYGFCAVAVWLFVLTIRTRAPTRTFTRALPAAPGRASLRHVQAPIDNFEALRAGWHSEREAAKMDAIVEEEEED